jgi:putative flippase GtrA
LSKNILLFIRFAGVGLVGTLAHYTVLVILVEGFRAGPVTASSSGYIVGALVNYLLNYFYTFGSNRKHIEALPRFYAIAAIGFGLNALIMAFLVGFPSVNYVLAQLVATGIVLIWNFAANKAWTFTSTKD